MNPPDISPLIEGLGWVLLHFLWQGAAAAAFLWLVLRFSGRRRPQFRYAAAGLAMLLMLGAASATLWREFSLQPPAPPVAEPPKITSPTPAPASFPAPPLTVEKAVPLPAEVSTARVPAPAPNATPSPTPRGKPAALPWNGISAAVRPWLPWLVGAWTLGVLALSLRLLSGWRTVRKWRASGVLPNAVWIERFDRLSQRLGLRPAGRLLSSAAVAVPMVAGWLKPVVLVPAALFAGLAPAQLEAILAHELAHIRRHDFLVNLLQNIVETLFFYHPAVWWVSAQLRKEREHCCDDVAASLCGGALDYARALTALEEIRGASPPRLVMTATGGSLLQRVRRIVGLPQEESPAWPLGLAAAGLAVAILSVSLLKASTDASAAGAGPAKPDRTPASGYRNMDSSLLRLRWQALEDVDSPIPESRVAGLRSAIGRFLAHHEEWGFELSAEKAQALKKLAAWEPSRPSHPAAEVAKMLAEVLAVHGEPIQMAFNESPIPGRTLSAAELDALPFGPAGAKGLRAAVQLLPRRETVVFGDEARLELTLWNTGSETLVLGDGSGLENVPSLRPLLMLEAKGQDGRKIAINTVNLDPPKDPVRFAATWQLRPRESISIYGWTLRLGPGEPRYQAWHSAYDTVLEMRDLRRNEAVTLAASLPWPKRPGDSTTYESLDAGAVTFTAQAPEDVEVWCPDGYGTWSMPGGVTLEVRGQTFHAADVMTDVVLTMPNGKRATVAVASDAFANREPWAIAWEAGKSEFWFAKGHLGAQGPRGFRGKATEVVKVHFGCQTGVPVITKHYTGWPKDGGPSAECRHAIEKRLDVPAEGTLTSETHRWTHANPVTMQANWLEVAVSIQADGLSRISGVESGPWAPEALDAPLRAKAAASLALWQKEMGLATPGQPRAVVFVPAAITDDVTQKVIRACQAAGLVPKPGPIGTANAIRGVSLDGLAVRDDVTTIAELYEPKPSAPGETQRKAGVFFMSLGQPGPWIYHAAGANHFYLEVRPDPEVVKDMIYGPISGHPAERLDLAGWLKDSPTHPDTGYAQRVARDMLATGDGPLAQLAAAWLGACGAPAAPRDHDWLIRALEKHLEAFPQSSATATVRTVLEQMKARTAAVSAAWEKERPTLPDSSYTAGEPLDKLGDDDVIWTTAAPNGLSLGLSGVKAGDRWEFGSGQAIAIYLRNTGNEPVAFAWTPRVDDGLDLVLTGPEGRQVSASITMWSTLLIHNRCRLGPGQFITLKGNVDFKVLKATAEGRSPEPDFHGNSFLLDEGGAWKFTARCHLGLADWADSRGGKQMRPKGEWEGWLETAQVDLTVAEEGTAAVPARPAPAYGPARVDGLRVAWVLDPAKETYQIGDILKCTVVFHNSGSQEITFQSDAWHQYDRWKVKDSQGEEIKVVTTWFSGITPQETVKLAPGATKEIPAHGVGIGLTEFAQAKSRAELGAEIFAKAGDALTCTWDVQVSPNGPYLTTGELKFKVAAAPPPGPRPPVVATKLGSYDLAPGTVLNLSQIGAATGYTNYAWITWEKARGAAADGKADIAMARNADPKDYSIPTFVFSPGGTALWIVEKERLRKADFSTLGEAKETAWKWTEAPADFGGAPEDVKAAIQALRGKLVGAASATLEKELEMAAPTDGPKEQLTLMADADGVVTVQGKSLDETALAKLLHETAAKDSKTPIVIRADAGTPTTRIVQIMEACRKAGLYRVAFATRKPNAVKGLQTTVAVSPKKDRYDYGEAVERTLTIKNVSDKPVSLRLPCACWMITWKGTDKTGTGLDATSIHPKQFESLHKRFDLAPGQSVDIPGGDLILGRDRQKSASVDVEYVQYLAVFPNESFALHWEREIPELKDMKSSDDPLKPHPGDWHGKLVSEPLTLNVGPVPDGAQVGEKEWQMSMNEDGSLNWEYRRMTFEEWKSTLANIPNIKLGRILITPLKTTPMAELNKVLEHLATLPVVRTKLLAAIPAPPKWMATGRVTDKDGKPVEGVEIWAATGMGSLKSQGPALTDADGSYRIEFSPGMMMSGDSNQFQTAIFSARKKGFGEANLCRQGMGYMATKPLSDEELKQYDIRADAVALPGNPRTVDFVMVPSATIKGRLLGSGKVSTMKPSEMAEHLRKHHDEHLPKADSAELKDAPLAGWRVWLKGKDLPPGASVLHVTTTDAEGSFVMEDVPQNYEWYFQCETNLPEHKEPVSIPIELQEWRPGKSAEFILKLDAEQERIEIGKESGNQASTDATPTGIFLAVSGKNPNTLRFPDPNNKDPNAELLAVDQKPVLTPGDIESAQAVKNDVGTWSVRFSIREEPAARLNKLLKETVAPGSVLSGTPPLPHVLAIVANGKCVTAPQVRGEFNREVEITGNFTETEARDIAAALSTPNAKPPPTKAQDEKPAGRRASKITIDPKLQGDFSFAKKSHYPWHIVEHDDGHLENTLGGEVTAEDRVKLPQTASVQTNSQGDHEIRFCEATLAGKALRLFLNDSDAAYHGAMEIVIAPDQTITCEWTFNPVAGKAPSFQTVSQRLTLDRFPAAAGEAIRGKLDVEVLAISADGKESTLTFLGLISTIVAGEKPEGVKADAAATTKSGISLTVLERTSHRPIPNFRVIAGVRSSVSREFEKAHGTVAVWQPHTLREGKDGGLVWPLEKAYDEMALRVEADGYEPQVISWIDKKKGPQEVHLELKESEGIPVLVNTPDGPLAVGATVILGMAQRDAVIENGTPRRPDGGPPEKAADALRWPRFATTDQEGRCTLPAETDVTAVVLVVHDSGVREMALRDLIAAKDGAVAAGKFAYQIKLRPWARISGRVQWGEIKGSIVPVNLTIHRDDYGYPGVVAQYEKTTTDAEGNFTLGKVLPGLCQLSIPIKSADGKSEMFVTGQLRHATVQSGGNTVLIGGAGRTVKGRLTGRDKWDGVTFHFHPTAPHIGFPGDDAMWKAWGEFQKSPNGPLFFRNGLKVNADGTFEVPTVLPGAYQIFFSEPGGKGHLASSGFDLPTEESGKAPDNLDIGEIKAR